MAPPITAGRLLSVETHQRAKKGDIVSETTEISVVTDAGDLRTFEVSPALSIHLADRDLNHEVSQYMSLVASTRERDLRRMVISTEGAGERRLFVSYISEVPVWKSTYRIVDPERSQRQAAAPRLGHRG